MLNKPTLLCGLLALAAPLAEAAELSFIRGPLVSTGVDADASGYVRSIFKGTDAQLWAELRGLTPDASYQFTVEGVTEATFVADTDGRATVKFQVSGAGDAALDFDPRGKEVAISDGVANVLSAIYTGAGEPAEFTNDERTVLTPVEGTTVEGRVRARYLDQKNKSRFMVQFHGMTEGTYTLRVGGVDVATVDLTRGRSTTVRFETNKHGTLKKGGNGKGNGKGPKNRHSLEFDPRGQLVEVLLEGNVVFSDVLRAKVHGLPVETTNTVELIAAPADPDATGSATITTSGTNEAERLVLSVANLAAGVYDVVIGGVSRGTITVTDDGAGNTAGELVFSTTPATGEVLLDFPLTGALEVSQAGTVYLSATLN